VANNLFKEMIEDMYMNGHMWCIRDKSKDKSKCEGAKEFAYSLIHRTLSKIRRCPVDIRCSSEVS
jgi:hypothetical protein